MLSLEPALNSEIGIHAYMFLSYLIAHVHAARPGCEKLIASFDCCVSVCVFLCMCPCKCVCMYACKYIYVYFYVYKYLCLNEYMHAFEIMPFVLIEVLL